MTVRTAGMAKGTPDWQLDRMYETDTAKALEKAYAEEPEYIEPIEELEGIRKILDQVVNSLLIAEDELNGTGCECTIGRKIREIMYHVEELDCDVGRIVKILKKGGAA